VRFLSRHLTLPFSKVFLECLSAPGRGGTEAIICIGRVVSIFFAIAWISLAPALAQDDINSAGGVLGRKIERVIEDNKSNPTEAWRPRLCRSVAGKAWMAGTSPAMTTGEPFDMIKKIAAA
jgi:hypothetical protein